MNNPVNPKGFVTDHSKRRTELIDMLRQTSTRISPKVRNELANLLEGAEDSKAIDFIVEVRQAIGCGKLVHLEDMPGMIKEKLEQAEVERTEATTALSKAMRVIAWFLNGKITPAAKNIVRRMLGIDPRQNHFHAREDAFHPRDVNEFGRCMLLLEQFPEWRERIADMAPLSKEWAVLAINWPKLEAEYMAEVEGKAHEGSTDGKILAYLNGQRATERVIA